jgi:hypothetical protein
MVQVNSTDSDFRPITGSPSRVEHFYLVGSDVWPPDGSVYRVWLLRLPGDHRLHPRPRIDGRAAGVRS